MGGKRSGISRKRVTLPSRARPAWLRKLDQRCELARTLNARLAAVADQLGGADVMTPIEQSLAERWVHLEGMAQRHEVAARDGRAFDLTAYLNIVARLHRLSVTLGTNRRARPAPSLAEYLRSKENLAVGG
jgi:hypothetical protein